MTVLNVLSTNSVAAGASEYQTVQTGYYRVGSTAVLLQFHSMMDLQ